MVYLVASSHRVAIITDEARSTEENRKGEKHRNVTSAQTAKLKGVESTLKETTKERDTLAERLKTSSQAVAQLRTSLATQRALADDRARKKAEEIKELQLQHLRAKKTWLVDIGREMATKDSAAAAAAREREIRAAIYRRTGVAIPFGWVQFETLAHDTSLHYGVAYYHLKVLEQDGQIEIYLMQDSDHKWTEVVRFTGAGAVQARQDHKEDSMSGDTYNIGSGSAPVIITRSQIERITNNVGNLGSDSQSIDKDALSRATKDLLEEVRKFSESQPEAASDPVLISSLQELEVAKQPAEVSGVMAKIMGIALAIGTAAKPLLDSAQTIFDMVHGH